MENFVVTYHYGTDTAAERDVHRSKHVEFLNAQFQDRRLLVSGPFDPEEDPGAVLVWAADSKAELIALLDKDPFSARGLIADRQVRQWNIFFGAIKEN